MTDHDDERDRLRARVNQLETQQTELLAHNAKLTETVVYLARQPGEAVRKLATMPPPARHPIPGDGVLRSPWERELPLRAKATAGDVEAAFEIPARTEAAS